MIEGYNLVHLTQFSTWLGGNQGINGVHNSIIQLQKEIGRDAREAKKKRGFRFKLGLLLSNF